MKTESSRNHCHGSYKYGRHVFSKAGEYMERRIQENACILNATTPNAVVVVNSILKPNTTFPSV
jgi:hypothetical protein